MDQDGRLRGKSIPSLLVLISALAVGAAGPAATPRRLAGRTPPAGYDEESGEPAGRMPSVGTCFSTRVQAVTTRLVGVTGSGTTILYDDGHAQVSYDRIGPVERSRRGDPVQLCAVSVPQGCPAGDFRGVVYRATDLRSRRTWLMPNAEHGCGGG